MKIKLAYGHELDDNILEQLLYIEADACAFYDRLDSGLGKDEILIGIIPTESLKHFRRRVANTLFLLRTLKTTSKKTNVVAMACISKRGKKNDRYLHTVYVKPLHRRKGIGKAIVKTAIKIAKKNKFHLMLNVNPLNDIALNLYKSLGFHICNGQSLIMEV